MSWGIRNPILQNCVENSMDGDRKQQETFKEDGNKKGTQI